MKSLPSGYRALVVGASGGIGAAAAELLRDEPGCGGVETLSRRDDGLDLTEEGTIAAAAERLRDGTPFDLVFDATGALTIDGIGPEKTIRVLDPQAMAKQFAVNAIGPALIFKHFLPLLRRDRRAVFATLSARVGSIGDNRLGGWYAYRASKAAQNQLLRTFAIELARLAPAASCLLLHPGTVDTDLSAPFQATVPPDRLFTPAQSAHRLLAVIAGAGPADSGRFLAYDGSDIPW
jgi:NAD(P)-dependent dehydrogenase (short-subunit alcohol dehydrogenase family)